MGGWKFNKMGLLKEIKNNKHIYRAYKGVQSFVYRKILSKRVKRVELNYGLTLDQISDHKNSFFGYYNISPMNKDRILFCVPRGENYSEEIEIYYHGIDGVHQKVTSSKAWNWQQGCMLHWYDEHKIILNDYDEINKQYYSRIVDLYEDRCRYLPIPIYALSHNRKFALSLNFQRLSVLRPDYGYFKIKSSDLMPLAKDGIWYMDFETDQYELLISLKDIQILCGLNQKKGAYKNIRVNHLDISPDDKRFMFLFRWVEGDRTYSGLIVYERAQKRLKLVHSGMISHCCWLNDNEIISFCRFSPFGNRYVKFSLDDGEREIIKNLPKVDGHPSIDDTGEWLVTDTYPDRSRMSSLYLYNFADREKYLLGRFFQPAKYVKQNRIDLHPKWASGQRKIFFESGHDGSRKLYCLDISRV